MPDFVRNNIITSKCTICDVLIDEVYEHPILKVSICKMCSKSGKASGDIVYGCMWCGDGADMVTCIQCNNQCCLECITRNMGVDFVNTLNEENWSCFVCDSDPIKELQEDYMRLVFSDLTHTRVPGACKTTVDILSPTIVLEEGAEESSTKKNVDNSNNVGNPSQDLDFILNVYEKQIQSSLEMDGANMAVMIREINSIRPDQLHAAIFSYKKCLAAFMSDLTNLESRVAQADQLSSVDGPAGSDPSTSGKLTALLRILVQHHLFNRLCHPVSRIKDDQAAIKTSRKPPAKNRSRPPDDRHDQWSKRPRMSDSGGVGRPQVMPSWLVDYAVDPDWTDTPAKRGRPPKYDDLGRPTGRGKPPKRTVFINVKEPRYCVQKTNGEQLASSL